MSQSQTKSERDFENVNPNRFFDIEPRQYYGGFAWFDEQTSEFVLAAQKETVVNLQNMR